MPTVTDHAFRSIISDRYVDIVRHLKVIRIGAGVSGVMLAINLPQQVQQLEPTIDDKNEKLGGTKAAHRAG